MTAPTNHRDRELRALTAKSGDESGVAAAARSSAGSQGPDPDWAASSLGTRDDMNSSRDDLESHPMPTSDAHDGVNLRPGQTDEGGHGGMATREQEARQLETQDDDDKSAAGTTPEPPD